MSTLTSLTPTELRRLADLQEEIQSICNGGLQSTSTIRSLKVVKRKFAHWTSTPAGRARMAAIQRKRWRKVKKNSK